MISILIPTYDEDVTALATALSKQAKALDEKAEVLICDQAPNGSHQLSNLKLNALSNVEYLLWNEKSGRSANRNYLAERASNEWLLFLDSDTQVISDDFLKSFADRKEKGHAICGKMVYSEEDPGPEMRLRWKYGRAREMKSAKQRNVRPFSSFLSYCFLIHKRDFDKVKFDEQIVEYGHEDTLFGKRLAHEFITPIHTDIPLLHTGLIPPSNFLDKVRQSVRSLNQLTERGLVDEDFKLYHTQQRLAKYRFDYLLALFYRIFHKAMEAQLCGAHPSLMVLDLYKLSYFCTFRKGVKTSSKTLRS
ncbi:glycosyltransferase [Phaeocystidibacter marisrubri]|uniref:Glycosyltransferase family 2 protein n=1 Tax=Phaeocystidibacter marisrubri TaxID=1577780 RepID=A0A6L3ZJ27_9FLAO|nr:glycosyltransferase [Phaeocystidibacter marisrubri]KAB2817170.1 glycosyltransferase family 2 protein [Phaeocystidibacter marisrubri]GGH76574.1 glycosyl transferase [Phaeocystidibacter marisrubri]